jgi:hypothetical protein
LFSIDTSPHEYCIFEYGEIFLKSKKGVLMKMIKIQILLMSALLGNALSLQGMMSQARLRQFQKVKVQKGLPKKPINVPTTEPVNMPNQKPTTQTWGNWFKSFFSTQPSKPVSYGTEENYTSPFERGGQKRMYGTYQSSTQTQIPESFQPSLKSRIPWTNEYKIEEMFKQMNEDLNERREDGTYKNSGSFPYNVDKFQELVKASGYNPVNRDIPGEPSFFAKLLIASFKKSLHFQYFQAANYPMPGYGEDVIQQFYQMGARCRMGEDWNQAVDRIRGLLRRIVAVTRIDRIETLTARNTLGEIINFASVNLKWYKFLNSIGLQDAAFNSSTINWDKIEELCELQLDPAKLKETIGDLQKNPKELLSLKYGMVRLVIMTKYGRSDRPISAEYVINLLKQAGFSSIGTTQQEQQYEQQRETQFGTTSFDVAKNKLTQLLGIPATSSEKEVSNAYRKFVMQYHPDVTKNPNNPMSLKLKNEINPAWDEYNEGLKQMKQEKAGRE